MIKPIVALVGRPNVGKSTLFNRLAGEQLAIVDGTPGTTRDRLLAQADWTGHDFNIIDTGGIDPSTGGTEPLSIGSADYIKEIRSQAELAIQNADVILFITDANSGVTPADHEIAQILRSKQKKKNGQFFPPVLLVANKADNQRLRDDVVQFYELGMGEPHPISSLHGTGTGDMLDVLIDMLPDFTDDEEDESVNIAIVGKPNVGKSSLLNRILGEERALVSPIAGTTRDAVDTYIEYEDIPITLIDTAGIRRRGRISPGVERFSVIRSMRAIDRCDVALLLIDATSGITAQDTHIAGFILDSMKSVVVLVNKWDAIQKDHTTMDAYKKVIYQELNFIDYVPLHFISAKTGKRVERVLPLALEVQEERLAKISTHRLNQIFLQAQDAHPAPSRSGKSFRIYYATQVRSDPPTFMLFVNNPSLVHFTYLRYLENQLRKHYPFLGTPVRIVLKARR